MRRCDTSGLRPNRSSKGVFQPRPALGAVKDVRSHVDSFGPETLCHTSVMQHGASTSEEGLIHALGSSVVLGCSGCRGFVDNPFFLEIGRKICRHEFTSSISTEMLDLATEKMFDHRSESLEDGEGLRFGLQEIYPDMAGAAARENASTLETTDS